jgi:hypothetical protein
VQQQALPDTKHNRIAAANMRFVQPDLPAIIAEIEALNARDQLFHLLAANP